MLTEQPLYDLSGLKAIGMDNETFIRKIVKMFCEQTPAMLADMRIAYYRNDLKALSSIAHKMKPGIDSLNIGLLKQIIRDIEGTDTQTMEHHRLGAIVDETEKIILKVIDEMKIEYPY